MSFSKQTDLTRRQVMAATLGAVGLSQFSAVGKASAQMSSLPLPDDAGPFPVDGGTGWYRINGREHFAKGRTPLVVAHGGPGMSHLYLLPLVALAGERPVIFWDQLDSGNAQRPGDPENWTVDRFVNEVDHLRAALGLDRLVLFGNSWGGTITLEYAARQPAGLEAVILSSPLVSTDRWISDNTAYRGELPKEVRDTLDTEEQTGTTNSAAYQDASMVFYRRHLNRQDPWPPELNAAFEIINGDLYNAMWGPTEFNATGTLKGYDGTDLLSRIAVPTLLTAGEYDEATPAAMHDFAKEIPDAQVEIIPDASHTAFLERSEAYLDVLRAFLRDYAGDG